VITLDRPLEFAYKRATVKINANLALATNGETVTETLGSGDGTQTFQSFQLHQSPLTYVSANTPSGAKSTLEVRVNDMLWKEVRFFYGHGPNEHIYITRQDANAVSRVMFGNGKTGSRLPTGTANVTAKYRRGIGIPGEVGANQLTMFASRPLAVRGVKNPLDASGAADPENLNDARQNATLTIRTLDRIVSIDDYQDFARAFAGIAKTIASWSWDGQRRVIVLTVAGVDGKPIDPEGDLASNLLSAIAASSEPGTQVRLFPHQPRFFKVEGTVDVQPAYLLSDVSANIENALRNAFSFTNRDFGQPTHRSEVIAAIQNVPGVQDVDLLAFYRSDRPRCLEIHIPAALPQFGGTDFFGADLLTLDPGPLGLQETQ
jgi:predicted phage baseplate assembly protein